MAAKGWGLRPQSHYLQVYIGRYPRACPLQEAPEHARIPDIEERVDSFERLLLVRCLREDRDPRITRGHEHRTTLETVL